MTTATDRGWGDPRSADFRRNVIPVTVGPFPAKGPLKKAHPAVTINFHKDAALLLELALIEAIRDHGCRLDGPQLDDWGYICRPIRGYETKYKLTRSLRYLSNHSWALAVDINAAQFPLGSLLRQPPALIEAFRRWGFEYGGDYEHRKDPMHFELTMTKAACDQKVRDLKKFFGVTAA